MDAEFEYNGVYNPLFEADMYAESYYEMKSLGYDLNFHPKPTDIYLKAFAEDERLQRDYPNVVRIGYQASDPNYLVGSAEDTSDPVRADRLSAYGDFLNSKLAECKNQRDDISAQQDALYDHMKRYREMDQSINTGLAILCVLAIAVYILMFIQTMV